MFRRRHLHKYAMFIGKDQEWQWVTIWAHNREKARAVCMMKFPGYYIDEIDIVK